MVENARILDLQKHHRKALDLVRMALNIPSDKHKQLTPDQLDALVCQCTQIAFITGESHALRELEQKAGDSRTKKGLQRLADTCDEALLDMVNDLAQLISVFAEQLQDFAPSGDKKSPWRMD